MPRRELDAEDLDQDWEPVVLKGGGTNAPSSKGGPSFGSQLVEARRLAQATQHSVAQSIGVPLKTVAAWEANHERPTQGQLVRLNRILRCVKKLK